MRQEVRDQYDLADCLVVGHVARLQYQKNQGFLLQAFARLKQRVRSSCGIENRLFHWIILSCQIMPAKINGCLIFCTHSV